MIDSVLKGTGNSRFLKSAVPAGTSWADALAMLQAGTFPIDFNGINAEGFQQVGTPLNKANLLKDATAAQIGLPPSTTPDGMFQALGNTGELHVWRKTVVNSQAQDAYYNLGSIIATSGTIIDLSKQSVSQVGFKLSGSVRVYDNGKVDLVDANSYYKYSYNSNMYQHRFLGSDGNYILGDQLSGQFISFYADDPSYYGSAYVTLGEIYYIPTTASLTYGAKLTISQLQPVIGHAAITAGTTTTYPVSTNPKAYQEGDDAKAAGYVVGEVVTGSFRVSYASNSTGALYGYCDSVTVDDNGVIHGKDTSSAYVKASNSDSLTTANSFKGKFIYLSNAYGITGIPFVQGTLYYIPTDAVFTRINGNEVLVDRYQPVTGYAAIPAGTTIEYLGKLGDKARVQVVSYVGTGTYGSDHPNSLTFDFVPKAILFMYRFGNSVDPNGTMYARFVAVTALNTTYKKVWFAQLNSNGNAGYMKISEDRKTVSWYNTYGAYYQSNESGTTYVFLAIG